MKKRRSHLVAVVLVSLLPVGVSAQGQDIDRRFVMRIGAGQSDNLRLDNAPTAADDSTFQTVGVDVGAERETARIRAFSNGSLDYYQYGTDVVDSNTNGWLTSGLDLKIVPSLVWRFGNEIGHVRRDPFRLAGPGNQERVTLFNSGPSLSVPLGGRYVFAAGALYSERQWEDSEALDSAQTTTDVSVSRALSSTQRVGLSIAEQDTTFDDAFVPGYNTQIAALTYSRRSRLMDLTISGGRNRLRTQGTSESKPYMNAVWTGRPAPRSSLTLRFTRRYEDAVARLVDGRIPAARLEVTDAPLANVAFDSTQVGLSYRLTRARAAYAFTTERARERFELATNFDRDRVRSTIGFRYQLSPTTSLNLQLRRGTEEYLTGSTTLKDRRALAELSRRLNRTWDIRLGYQEAARRGATARAFDEKRYDVALVWSPVSQSSADR